MTGRCGQRGSELSQSWQVLEVAEAQTAPIGVSPDAIRLGKIICAVLLTKTEGKAFNIVHLTEREQELSFGGFYAQNTRDLLEHVWETWYVMWCARENTG